MIGWVVGAQAAQHEGGERDDQGRQDAGGMGAAARQECPEGQGRALDEEERCELLRLQEPPRRGQGAQADPQMGCDGSGRVAVGPSVLKRIHEQMVRIARDKGITTGRRMRVDTTVVETNIHHPTDSTLLGDGVRVLTRIMKKITAIAGTTGTRLRDRSRSVKLRVLEIARVS